MPILKILLVEDNHDNQKIAKQFLVEAGFLVDIVENGTKAVEAASRYSYKLILMDIQMPGIDGYETTELIRKLEATRGGERIPIIALTACTQEGCREKCLVKGMDDYISKPVTQKKLIETLDKWLDRRPSILVVDDVEDNRKLIKKYLSKEDNYRVIFAKNGIEAIAAFKNQAVSLILLDMEMPVMDGYTAARIIRQLDGMPEIPIIAMTSHEGQEEIRKCIEMGCTGYVYKPMRESELLAVIHQYLEKAPVSFKQEKEETKIVTHADPYLAKLIPGYLENRLKDAEEIKKLLSEGNFQEILRLGHRMKGSGGGYGFDIITTIGGNIEDAARKENRKEIEKYNNKLTEYISGLKVVFSRNN